MTPKIHDNEELNRETNQSATTSTAGCSQHGVAMFLFSVPPDAVLDELLNLYNNWRDSE